MHLSHPFATLWPSFRYGRFYGRGYYNIYTGATAPSADGSGRMTPVATPMAEHKGGGGPTLLVLEDPMPRYAARDGKGLVRTVARTKQWWLP